MTTKGELGQIARRLTEYTQLDRSVMMVEGAKVEAGFPLDRECFRLITDL